MEVESNTNTKICSKCKIEKPTEEYHKKRSAPNGIASKCKPCTSEYRRGAYRANREAVLSAVREYRKNNPDAVRDSKLRSTYGISLETYTAMFERQRGRCAICGRTPEEAGHRNHYAGRLCVDHCHESMGVRELLCHGCNIALGHFEDSAPRLLSAVDYLKKHEKEND